MSAVEQGQQQWYRVELRQAVHYAQQYLSELVGDDTPNLRLEEIEIDRETGTWRVTLGYDEEQSAPAESANLLTSLARPRRVYTVITLDANTGVFQSMKMRTL